MFGVNALLHQELQRLYAWISLVGVLRTKLVKNKMRELELVTPVTEPISKLSHPQRHPFSMFWSFSTGLEMNKMQLKF